MRGTRRRPCSRACPRTSEASLPSRTGSSTLSGSSSRPVRPSKTETAAKLERFHVHLREILGSTETGGIALRDLPEPTWRPMPGIQVESDSEGRLLLESPFLDARVPRPFACADRIVLDGRGGFDTLDEPMAS